MNDETGRRRKQPCALDPLVYSGNVTELKQVTNRDQVIDYRLHLICKHVRLTKETSMRIDHHLQQGLRRAWADGSGKPPHRSGKIFGADYAIVGYIQEPVRQRQNVSR
ncbi:MAG: hypothetical protein ACK4QP_01225 [Pseudorhizobium sp.]